MGTLHAVLAGDEAGGADRFSSVTIRPDGSPFRMVFRFSLALDATGAPTWVCVGLAVDQEGHEPLTPVTAPVLSELKKFERMARLHLNALAADATRPREIEVEASAPRRKILSDHFLRSVADRYRELVAEGKPPTQTLMREWGVSRRTVGSWLATARQRELLGPARRGVAGEDES
jgi:hypothetical protein